MPREFIARNGVISLGNIVVSGSITTTGTVAISGSFASASFAATASSADNFLTRGTLTAQTLVVQTITSSVDFVTGSTRFGSLLANTHQFTGSVNITGSLSVVTNGTEFQVGASGVNLGNALTDSHVISGSLTVNPNGLFVSGSGLIGIGTSTPAELVEIFAPAIAGTSQQARLRITQAGSISARANLVSGVISGENPYFAIETRQSASPFAIVERLRIDGNGNVCIGSTSFTSPSGADTILGVYGGQDCSLILQDAVQLWELYVNDDFYINRGSTNALTISRTNSAATFSNSVTAVNFTSTDRFVASANAAYRVNTTADGVLGYMLRSGLWKGNLENNLAFATDGAYNIVFFTNGSTTERLRIQTDGIIYALNSGVDGVYQPMIGGMYTSNNNETNLISTAVSSVAAQSGFRFDVSNGAGSSARTTSMTINRSSVTIVGSLSKGSGSFRIKHPLASKKDTHQLVHSFIEGPQADLIYSGGVTLVNGKATINIDEAATMTEGTFEALCRNIRVFTSNETSWDNVRGKITGNILTIESQNTESTDEISWLVIGERQDEHMIDTEWTDENGKVIVEPLITE
jgi:hypothetical protein